MTTTADTGTSTPVDDEPVAAPLADTDQPEQAESAKGRAKPHTNVPAPLAGPARRTALALGVPSLGLAELLVHANFGWAGVAAFTTAAAVGAGAVYAVRKQQRAAKATGAASKVGASKTPSSLASRLRAKPVGHSPARAGGTGSAGGRAPRGGLAGRMMNRLGGRGGSGGAFGRGGGLGGRSRGVAGRSGARSGFGAPGHTGGGKGRAGRALSSSPGARAAAAKSAHLTGGRPSKTSAGLRKLSGTSPRGKAGRSSRSGGGLGGGSFFGGGGKSRPSSSRHRGHRGGGGRPHSTSGGGHHGGHHPSPRRGRSRAWGLGFSWRRRGLVRRPRARAMTSAVGAFMLGALAVPVVAAGVVFAGAALAFTGLAVGGAYGAFRLATSTRVRYGASVIAGWMRLGVSRVYQWARAQWWKARGKTTAAEVFVAEGETVDEPYTPTSPRRSSAADGRETIDAEVVPDTPRPRYQLPPVPGVRRPAKPKSVQEHQCQWFDSTDGRQCPEFKGMGERFCPAHQRMVVEKSTCTWSVDPSDPLSRCGGQIEPGNTYCPYHQKIYDAIPLITPAEPRQPKLSHTKPALPTSTAKPQQEISIVSALDDITAAIAAAPAFTPTSGHDAEQYLESIVDLLGSLGTRVSSDLQTIGENLPQEAAALGTLNSLGEVLGAFATQAGEQVEAWKQTANWVWNQG